MTERQIERLSGGSKVRNIPGINNSGLGHDLRNAGGTFRSWEWLQKGVSPGVCRKEHNCFSLA